MTLLTLYDDAMLRGHESVPVIGRLGGGTIAAVSDHQPFRVTGANAVVYQLRQANGKVEALRCWLRDDVPAEVFARYRALGDPDNLRRLAPSRHSPIVSSIAIHVDGVVTAPTEGPNTARPVVVLDWLMGPTVLSAVDRACRSGDRQYLAALANAWSGAVTAAGEVGFVHGDLTADNAIVRPKEGIAFIDYDTAYWPDAPMVPQLDPALAYRHPRGVTTHHDRADDFAALVVYVSLHVLSVWPELRAENGQPATVKGAGLIFHPKDLAHPDGSTLFGKLRVLNDATALGLISILREACLAEPDEVPAFHEALELAANVAEAHPHVSRGSRVTSILASAATVVRETASKGTDRLRQAARPASDESWPAPQRTWRPERVVDLVNAIADRDLARAEEAWFRVHAEQGAGALLPALEKLRAEVNPARQVAVEERRARRDAQRRETIQRHFANALDHDDRDALADMALSGELDEVDGLSEASTLRIVGSLAIPHLERALATDDDNVIIDAYDEQILSDHGLLTQDQRNRVDLAFDRRSWLGDIRAAIRSHDVAAIDRLMTAMPAGADEFLRDRERIRIERLHDQDRAVGQLWAAINDKQDSAVMSALSTVERTGATLPAEIPWTEVSGVIDRQSLVAAIIRAAEQTPRDLDRLGRLLPQLKDLNGGEWPGGAERIDFARLAHEVTQAAQIVRIREAIAADDDRQIVTAALPDVYTVLPLLDRAEQARIERAVAAGSRALRRSGHRSSNAASSAVVETV